MMAETSNTAVQPHVQMALIGCGAVAQARYLPAADLVPGLSFEYVVDLDVKRAQEVAERYHIPNWTDDYRKVLGEVTAVVVATPPRSHPQISIDCLEQGVHVLCEKPLATSVREAQAMIDASTRGSAHLAVGMNRRLSWSSCMLRTLVQSRMLGEVLRFEVEEGYEFNWPLVTGHIFRDSVSGGVLADTGVHVFDLVMWILGGQRADLLCCETDNWGGVETNAWIELEVECPARQVPGTIELSFTRELRNTMRIYGERGWLEASIHGRYVASLHLEGEQESIHLSPGITQAKERVEEFALQLQRFASSISAGPVEYVPAHDVLKTIDLIERCRRDSRRVAHPWEVKHLEDYFKDISNG